ncbi:unnamed protein product [Rhizophagus irregularis]|nr:unnamed protein product [Rhizophagus irregularis]CAB4421991.1 unnamed protein product [Rhizophagus irregularis]
MESNREFSDDWDFLNSNDLSVEDFWMVLYFQTLPYDGFIRVFRHSSALWRLFRRLALWYPEIFLNMDFMVGSLTL